MNESSAPEPALHWDWACDRLDERRLGFLRAATRRQLDLVNHDPRPEPATSEITPVRS